MDPKLFFIIILALVLIIVIISEKYYNKNLFYPSKNDFEVPTEDHEDILHKGISMRYFPHLNRGDRHNKIILFCHGNSGNISHRSYMIEICKKYKINLMLFDYFGYGKSLGKPTPSSIMISGDVAFQWILENGYKMSDIIIWGESLGGSVAVNLAAKNPDIKTLVMQSTFSSIDDVIMDHSAGCFMTSLGYFCKIFLDNLPSKKVISKVNCPVIVIHSRNDELIPFRQAKKLYENIAHRSKVLIPIMGGHATPKIDGSIQIEIFQFLAGRDIEIDDITELNEKLSEIQRNLLSSDIYI